MRQQIEAILRGDAPPPPVAELLGIRLVSVGEGECVFEMEARPEHANPMGTVQGGVICALADAAMGLAYASLLDAGESFTTLELKTNYLRQVAEGRLLATGRVVHSGRTIGLITCDVVDGEGRKVAHATSTCMTLREQR
ncbi:MAG: PaaI family thioesterase [Verrucomicrobiota bacterium]